MPTSRRAPLRRSSARPLRWVGRAALLAALYYAVRTGLRARRELADFRIADARLRDVWQEVPALDGVRRLRMHARVDDHARTRLPPVVLVHGFGLGSSYLVPLAARLGRHAHVYAPDLPGHGLSEHDERGLKVPELASALAAFMDASRVRSAVLVGHSLGCAVVAELAARRPDLAVGVVLVSPASDPAVRRKPGEQLRRALRASWHERPTFAFWAAADARRAGRTVLATELQELNEHRIEDVLPDVRAPVRVVRGEHDELVPQRWAEAIARLVDAPSPTVIPGWGHAVNYDAPDALVKVVFSLVRSLTQAATTVKPVVDGDPDAPIPHGVRPPAGGGAASATVR